MDRYKDLEGEVVSDPLGELARIAGAEAPVLEGCQMTARCPYAGEARAILSGEKGI